MKRFSTFILVLFSSQLMAQPGTLDQEFNGDGEVVLDGFGHEDTPTGIGSFNNQPIMAGYSVDWLYEFVIYKFNEDGSPDLNFSSDGFATNDFFDEANAFCSGLAVMDNGEIILGGHSTEPGQFIFFQGFMKYQTNGSIDQSFGNNGKVQFWDEGNEPIRCWDLITPNGSDVLAVGTYGFSPSWASVTRFDEVGNIDIGFGNGGITWAENANQGSAGYGVIQMSNGRIIVAGVAVSFDTDVQTYLSAFNQDGSLATEFGDNGEIEMFEPDIPEEYRAIAVYDDTHFIAAGHKGVEEERDGLLRKYDVDGNPDNTFGNGGTLLIDYLGFKDDIKDIVVQPDGKILIGLEGEDEDGQDDFVVVRLNADGSYDTTFGTDGVFAITGPVDDDIMRMALQDDGKLLVAGIRDDEDGTTGLDHLLVRILTGVSIGLDDLENESLIPLIYPNPVTSGATFEFELSRAQEITIELLDGSGRSAYTFESQTTFPAGKQVYSLEFGEALSSGIYFLRIVTEEGQASIRVQLVD